jgi:hypothetical protein
MAKKTPTSSALRAYLDTTKKPTVVLGEIERHLLLKPLEFRRQDVLHPSEITSEDWCIRKSWFACNGYDTGRENPGLRLATIFSDGHSIHEQWQGWIADVDMLIGVWECEEHWRWWGKRSDSCLSCPHVEYHEVPVQHTEMVVAGHADGWIDAGKQHYILEIKSMGMGTLRTVGFPIVNNSLSESFRNINRPFNTHIRQATMYIYCLRWMYHAGILEDPPPDKMLFLYVCKEDGNAREFIVDYDEDYLAGFFAKRADLNLDSLEPPDCTGSERCRCSDLGVT